MFYNIAPSDRGSPFVTTMPGPRCVPIFGGKAIRLALLESANQRRLHRSLGAISAQALTRLQSDLPPRSYHVFDECGSSTWELVRNLQDFDDTTLVIDLDGAERTDFGQTLSHK